MPGDGSAVATKLQRPKSRDIEAEIETFVQCFKRFSGFSTASLTASLTSSSSGSEWYSISPQRPNTLNLAPPSNDPSAVGQHGSLSSHSASHGTSDDTSSGCAHTSSSAYDQRSLSDSSSSFDTCSEGPSPLAIASKRALLCSVLVAATVASLALYMCVTRHP